MKIAQMGMRSKCKDAMAVLERIPNPQSIRLPKFHILESEPAVEMCGMIFSSSLNTLQIGVNSSLSPPDSLSKMVSPIASCSNDEEVQKCPEDNSFDKQTLKADLQCAKSEMALHDNCIYNAYLKPDSSPTHSFKLVSAEASVDYTILKEHKMDYRISKCNAKEKFNLRCTACGIESDKLRMIEDFHEHIMNCGKYRR
ncbi:unnamed protein product [Cercopithifilaria johnstoni]|uniref:Uncharacterized protein n=1 Tax=Cercopithifilaria johnstoni TaxID=2874296 RepID=A0A8J2MF52_9BILA|nr:unnamed protein product [Cercopithifilaria johnstoni]